MACFIVPATEAVISTIVTKALTKREETEIKLVGDDQKLVDEIKESRGAFLLNKMKWLNNLLWGGSVLLAFEHVWHGEVVPFFPFLTAASNSKDAMQMLHEMGTVGVAMAATVTGVWVAMVAATDFIKKNEGKLAGKRDSRALGRRD